MKGHIWDLGPQTNGQGREINLGAWEITEGRYFVLSRENLGRSAVIECVQGQTEWHLTHQYVQGPLPTSTIIDHTDPEVLDSYMMSEQGLQAVLVGMCKYLGTTPTEIFDAFHQWCHQQENT